MLLEKDGYLEKLGARRAESRVHRRYQLVGLALAEFLRDLTHKSLYIRLAKERNPEELLALAKRISEQKNIRNKGAYFMACLRRKNSKRQAPNSPPKADPPPADK